MRIRLRGHAIKIDQIIPVLGALGDDVIRLGHRTLLDGDATRWKQISVALV